MPDVETMREFIRRLRAVAALREAWLATEYDPAARAAIFPLGVEPGETWRTGTFDDEDHAIAAGVAAVWP